MLCTAELVSSPTVVENSVVLLVKSAYSSESDSSGSWGRCFALFLERLEFLETFSVAREPFSRVREGWTTARIKKKHIQMSLVPHYPPLIFIPSIITQYRLLKDKPEKYWWWRRRLLRVLEDQSHPIVLSQSAEITWNLDILGFHKIKNVTKMRYDKVKWKHPLNSVSILSFHNLSFFLIFEFICFI